MLSQLDRASSCGGSIVANGRATALTHSEPPEILKLHRRLAYVLVYVLAAGAVHGAGAALVGCVSG
jgi:hypothetical protein